MARPPAARSLAVAEGLIPGASAALAKRRTPDAPFPQRLRLPKTFRALRAARVIVAAAHAERPRSVSVAAALRGGWVAYSMGAPASDPAKAGAQASRVNDRPWRMSFAVCCLLAALAASGPVRSFPHRARSETGAPARPDGYRQRSQGSACAAQSTVDADAGSVQSAQRKRTIAL